MDNSKDLALQWLKGLSQHEDAEPAASVTETAAQASAVQAQPSVSLTPDQTKQGALAWLSGLKAEDAYAKENPYYRYQKLTKAQDFAEKSQYVSTANGTERTFFDLVFNNYAPERSGWDDPLYEHINGNQEASAWISNAAAADYGDGLGAIYGRKTESKNEAKQMTDEEVSIFNYLYATQGKEAAHEFYEYLESDLYARDREASEAYWAQYAKDDPFGSSVFSTITSPLKGLSYLGQATDMITTGTIDENAPYNSFVYENSAIRSQVAKSIEESGKWGSVGSFAYQTAMSMADFLTTTAVSGGNGALSMLIMGSGAAADMTLSAKARGLSDGQAFTLGTIAGLAEAVTERFSLEALLKPDMSKTAVEYILKNTLTEATEEGASTLINTMADLIVSKDQSQWAKSIQSYRDSGKSEAAAFGLALADQAVALGLDMLGGAISGGFVGTGGAVVNYGSSHKQNATQAQQAQGGAQGGENVQQAQTSAGGNSAATAAPGAEQAVEAEKNADSEETTVTVRGAGPAINESSTQNNTLGYKLASNLDAIRDMQPVKGLTGKEFNNKSIKLTDQIANFFKSLGNKVMRAGFGDVELGEYGVGGIMNHRPLNRAKMVSLAAVPEVIQNGRQISYEENWKGRGYESYIFAAPVTVNGTEVYVAAVVDKRPNNKFYLSEMVDSEGNYVRIEESPSGNSKNGVTDGAGDSGKAGVTARPEGLPEGGNPSATNTEPTPLFNNSIPKTPSDVKHGDTTATVPGTTPNESVGAAVDSGHSAQYDGSTNQGGAEYGTGEAYWKIQNHDRTGGNDPSSNVGTPAEEGNRSGIQSEIGRKSETLGTDPGVRPEEVNNKAFREEDMYSPEKGTPLADVKNRLETEYGIPCHVVKASAWHREHPAFARNGVVYVSDAIDADTISDVVPHEATHVMKQNGFAPYLNLIQRTSEFMNLSSDQAHDFLERTAIHIGVDLFSMNETDVSRLYDELNAAMYGAYIVGDLNNSVNRAMAAEAFADLDGYLAELDSIHEQYRAQVKGQSQVNAAVGAADANFTGKQAYYDSLSDDNVKPGREGDVRNVEVPKVDGYGRRVSDFVTNAVGAEVTTDEMAGAIEELIGEGALGFDVKSDKSLLDEAADAVKKSVAGSRNSVTKAAMSGKATDVDIAKAMLLYNIYNQRNDTDNASEIMVDLATMANDAGRKLRLFSLLRKMTPEGQAAVIRKTVERCVDRINKSRSGKNQAEVTIPQELMDAYTDAARRDSYEHSEESEQAKVEAEQAVYKAAAAQIKASPMEKLNAWRYMAMLGNAKTQLRNFAGNALFRPLVSIKRAVGAAIESVTLEQKDRTKAVLGFGEDAKALMQWAGEDVKSKTAQDLLSYCGQTGDAARNAIEENRQIYDTKWLEAVRDFVQAVPEKADMLFKKQEYTLSLASFLKARGYTAGDIQSGKVSQDVLNEGRAYAAQEALKATFNDQNALSDLIVNMRYKGNNKALQVLNLLGEGVMPFRRTPANIVVRGLEYSPVGLVRGICNAAVNVRSGKISAATAIDQIAGGLTGTGMMVLGHALASGIFGSFRLRGKVDEEEKLTGHQSWALEIGDQSYDISWLAPSNIPLLVGANLYELGSENGNNWLVNAASATVTALEPMLELSCLSSLNDLIESVRYSGDGEALYSIAASAATNYLTQFIPTLLGQAEQAFEGEKKSVYSNADTALEKSLEKTVGRVTQKIPGIDLFQTEKVDKWGRTQEKDAVQKAFDAFINPSKVTTIEETDADKELERLREAVPDENVYPGNFRKEVSYTDSEGKTQSKVLTAEEYTKLAKVQGQQSRELVEKITGMDDYKGLTDAEKAKVIQRIYEYSAAVSKSAVIEGYHEEPSYITNRAKGMSVEDAIIRQEIVGTTKLYADLPLKQAVYISGVFDLLEKEKKADGTQYTQVRTVQKVEALADSNLSEKQQKDVMDDILDDGAYEKYVKILAAGYDTDDYAAAYRLYQDTEKTKHTGKKEMTIRGFMTELGISRYAAQTLYDIYAGKDD